MTPLPSTVERRRCALHSLHGLAVGDGLGERFFWPEWDGGIKAVAGTLPPPQWWWTDDTNMALSIVDVLGEHGCVDHDALAADFLARWDRARGYGPGTERYLAALADGAAWREAATSLFDGQGSAGNGAAMRVAPLGAWFAGDPKVAAREARASAEVSHAHPDAIEGAAAVAVAASLAASSVVSPDRAGFLRAVAEHLRPGPVADGVRAAASFRGRPAGAAKLLGNGSRSRATDTVPFAIWCAAGHLDDYEAALWATVRGWGDVDTTCAIAGGIVAARVGVEGIPAEWRARAERLPAGFEIDA